MSILHTFLIAATVSSSPAADMSGLKYQHKADICNAEGGGAMEACNELIQSGLLSPSDLVLIYYSRGTIYLNLKNYQSAIRDYSASLKLNPNFMGALVNRGVAYDKRRQYELAVSDFSTAIRLRPDLINGYALRASTYSELYETDKAIGDYSRALGISRDAMLFAARGALYATSGEYALAIADSSQAIELKPDLGLAYALRASGYRHLGRLDEAFRDYDKAVQVEPHNSFVFSTRCWARAALKRQLDLALADCDVAVQDRPDYTGVYDSRAFLYLQSGQYDKAIADYNRALSLDPKNPDALFGRGIVEHRLGRTSAGDKDIAVARMIDSGIDHDYSEDGVKP